MTLSSTELWQKIAAAGLASPMQCRSWAGEVAEHIPISDTTDGLKVLQTLIQLDKLSGYQAKVLAGQSSNPLHRGPWAILGRVKQPLWSGWTCVAKVDLTKAGSPQTFWARWLSAEDLQGLRSSAPSLPRALQLSQVRHENLQSVFPPELVDAELQLLVAPAQGALLSNSPRERRGHEWVTNIILQIADGLAALHRANLVHGRVFPDRIVADGDVARLACDPISLLTGTLDTTAVGLLGEQLGEWKTPQFLAPEFIAPGQMPTRSSDVYALGCTWWWLLTGQPIALGSSQQQILADHTQAVLELPKGCELPEPLLRCLKHCLAKNQQARFASAIELSQALKQALSIVRAGPTVLPIAATVARTEPQVAPSKQQSAPSVKPAASSSQPAAKIARSRPAERPAEKNVDRTEKNIQVDARRERTRQPAALKVEESPRAEPASDGPPQHQPLASQDDVQSVVVTPSRGPRRRRSNKWLLPVAGACAFLILALLVLKFSGALQPATQQTQQTTRPNYVPPVSVSASKIIERDPRLDVYDIVEDSDQLWVPPSLPTALQLDLLPPGGQLFFSFRPADLLSNQRKKTLLAAFEQQVAPLLQWVSDVSGQPVEAIGQVTLGFYSAKSATALPEMAMRIELLNPKTLADLKSTWKDITSETFGEQQLLTTPGGKAFYIAAQPLVDAQTVSEFSVGPLEFMREVAELKGLAGPLTLQMESLHRQADRDADICILFSPRYLFSEGRGLLLPGPSRLPSSLRDVLGGDTRAALIQTRFEPNWYLEIQLVGASDRDAPALVANLQSKLQALPSAIENWFVEESPQTYWRGLALRFPQMLRTAEEFSRFGVEDGAAIMNAYLAPEAAPNLLLASWIALQDTATIPGSSVAATGAPTPAQAPLSLEAYLGRTIRLSFDQEPIEVALSLIGEAANRDLPAGTPTLSFVLDGDAFEKAGITRNQQLRDFNMNGKSVREALTEVAKRGNPVTTVTDTRQEDQRLIWVVMLDPQNSQPLRIALTTRAAAAAAGIALTPEFAAVPE